MYRFAYSTTDYLKKGFIYENQFPTFFKIIKNHTLEK